MPRADTPRRFFFPPTAEEKEEEEVGPAPKADMASLDAPPPRGVELADPGRLPALPPPPPILAVAVAGLFPRADDDEIDDGALDPAVPLLLPTPPLPDRPAGEEGGCRPVDVCGRRPLLPRPDEASDDVVDTEDENDEDPAAADFREGGDETAILPSKPPGLLGLSGPAPAPAADRSPPPLASIAAAASARVGTRKIGMDSGSSKV